jgi:RNA-binding protein YlmH
MSKADPLFARKILDQLDAAERSHRLASTRFLTPAELKEAAIVSKKAGWLPATPSSAGFFSHGG